MAAVLHCGAARNHRANPAAALKLEHLYGTPVLLSGLGSLVLTKPEINQVNSHHKESLQYLLRLLPNTPQCVYYFLGGSLPGEALLHLRQFSLLGMIMVLKSSILHRHGLNVFTTKASSVSWFYVVRNLCLRYQLPHPIELLKSNLTKESFKNLAKKHVLNYWELKLRDEAAWLTSLRYFNPKYMSLSKPHPIMELLDLPPTRSLRLASKHCSCLAGTGLRPCAATGHPIQVVTASAHHVLTNTYPKMKSTSFCTVALYQTPDIPLLSSQ